MHIILDLTLPFFAVIALGALSVHLGMTQDSAAKTINVFVFNFAMPALVISGLARQDIGALINWGFLSGWTLAGIGLFVLGAFFSRLFFHSKLNEMAISGQSAALGNTGFLGFPLMATAFDDKGLLIASSGIMIDMMIIIPLSIAFLEASGGGSLKKTFKRIIKGALFNPFIFAIIIGFLLAATGIGLPGPSDRFITFLAGAAGPAALFALGISLAKLKIAGDIAPILTISLFKLLLHPLIVFICLTLFGVDRDIVAMGVVLAALPVAGNVFVIAQQYDTLVTRTSSAILISTVAAVLTTAYALSWAGL